MLLTVPVSTTDVKLLPTLQKAFEAFPPGVGHDLLVVAFPKVAKEAIEFCELVKHHFVKATVHRLGSDFLYGWPMEMNALFQGAAMEVQRTLKQGECWMWFEADTAPIKPNWLSVLHSAYYADTIPAERERREPKRFLGVRETTIRSMNGERMNADIAGDFMVPTGVYPSNFAFIAEPLLKVAPQTNEPFYYSLQWYVINSLQETDIIQNNRETVNYKDGACESISRNAWDIHWNNPIGKNAMVVHGCKDGSLLEAYLPKDAPKTIVEQVGTAGGLMVSPFEKFHSMPGMNSGTPPTPSPLSSSQVTPAALPPGKPTPAKRKPLSPEERKRRSDNMKAMLARQRAKKLGEPALT